MMKEENILKNKFGKENHFSVPNGYFDSFADKLMEKLPEQETRIVHMRAQSWWQKVPVRKIAAVMGGVVVLAAGALGYSRLQQGGHEQFATASHRYEQVGSSSGGTFEQMADYTMMDNETIYASLLAEN